MKLKIKILIFCILSILLLSSCNKNIDLNNNYFYQVCYNNGNIIFLKYNIITGSATPVCNDPLCSHDSDECPFYGISYDFAIDGQYIYYTKEMIGKNNTYKYSLIKYDMLNDSINILYESNDMLSQLFIFDDYLYFWNSIYVNGVLGANLIKYNLKSQNYISLTETPSEYRELKYAIESGRIYWIDIFNTGICFSTDPNYKDRKVSNLKGQIYNGYAYIIESQNDKNKILTRVNIDTYKKKTICDDIAEFKIYFNKIFYLKYAENPKLIGSYEDGTEVYDKYDGKVYMMDLDGQNLKLLCSLSGHFINTMSLSFYNNMAINNYIGIPINNFVFDENNYIVDVINTDIAIINNQSGQWVYSSYK